MIERWEQQRQPTSMLNLALIHYLYTPCTQLVDGIA